MAARGNVAFVSVYDNQVATVDLTDPINPSILGTVATPLRPWGLAISGDYCFAAAGNELYVIDISDLNAPTIATTLPSVSAYSIDVYRDNLYASRSRLGLGVYDISSPTRPKWTYGVTTQYEFTTTVSVGPRGVLFGGTQSAISFTSRPCD